MIKSANALPPLDTKMKALELLYKIVSEEKEKQHPQFAKEIVRNRDKLDDFFNGIKTCLNALQLQ
jgi:hypothetical protein